MHLPTIAANQITNAGFTYDANGNMTSDGTLTYIYDGENGLKEVRQGLNTIATYTYDYMGRRTSITEAGVTTYYHYDGWNVVAETDSLGSTAATYAYDGSTSLTTGQPISMTRGGVTYYYQYNAHGDVVSLTNNLGQVVNTYSYDPWGKVLTANEQVSNPYRYAGYRYDGSTGLYYLQNRYYSPEVYRFLTKDLVLGQQTTPQTWNGYSYCENNPLNSMDPTGLWKASDHRNMTKKVAKRLRMKPNERCFLGNSNYWFDNLYSSFVDLSVHFDMFPGQRDSRLEFAEGMLRLAVVLKKQGQNDLALASLGAGLHSVQDYYAHVGPEVISPVIHLLPGNQWDDPNWRPDRHENAELETQHYLESYIERTKSE